jgi:Reverse transcriptase (RNA-dependent DNA polymerase)
MLRCSVEELTRVEATADDLYHEVRLIKKDGTPRICYDAKYPLKGMQGRIQCMILKKVKYPSHLMGGLADPENPRDYVRNARAHMGARIMINEDVAGFYPSTSSLVVFDIWRHLFHFPAEVSWTLTRLTTRAGQLPQGAKTSSYLANLVFWGTEPGLVTKLSEIGFEYTRYIDDMTISSKSDKTAEEIGLALSMLASMVKRYGFKFKRKKHSIVYAGQRMEVTGLVVGEESAGLRQSQRSGIRALVRRCEVEAHSGSASGDSQTMLRRAASFVGQYARIHPVQGQVLKRRLEAIRA